MALQKKVQNFFLKSKTRLKNLLALKFELFCDLVEGQQFFRFVQAVKFRSEISAE